MCSKEIKPKTQKLTTAPCQVPQREESTHLTELPELVCFALPRPLLHAELFGYTYVPLTFVLRRNPTLLAKLKNILSTLDTRVEFARFLSQTLHLFPGTASKDLHKVPWVDCNETTLRGLWLLHTAVECKTPKTCNQCHSFTRAKWDPRHLKRQDQQQLQHVQTFTTDTKTKDGCLTTTSTLITESSAPKEAEIVFFNDFSIFLGDETVDHILKEKATDREAISMLGRTIPDTHHKNKYGICVEIQHEISCTMQPLVCALESAILHFKSQEASPCMKCDTGTKEMCHVVSRFTISRGITEFNRDLCRKWCSGQGQMTRAIRLLNTKKKEDKTMPPPLPRIPTRNRSLNHKRTVAGSNGDKRSGLLSRSQFSCQNQARYKRKLAFTGHLGSASIHKSKKSSFRKERKGVKEKPDVHPEQQIRSIYEAFESEKVPSHGGETKDTRPKKPFTKLEILEGEEWEGGSENEGGHGGHRKTRFLGHLLSDLSSEDEAKQDDMSSFSRSNSNLVRKRSNLHLQMDRIMFLTRSMFDKAATQHDLKVMLEKRSNRKQGAKIQQNKQEEKVHDKEEEEEEEKEEKEEEEEMDEMDEMDENSTNKKRGIKDYLNAETYDVGPLAKRFGAMAFGLASARDETHGTNLIQALSHSLDSMDESIHRSMKSVVDRLKGAEKIKITSSE